MRERERETTCRHSTFLSLFVHIRPRIENDEIYFFFLHDMDFVCEVYYLTSLFHDSVQSPRVGDVGVCMCNRTV